MELWFSGVDTSHVIRSSRARGEDFGGAPNVSEAAPSIPAPEPGSAVELATFRDLQSRLPDLFRKVFPDPRAPRTVVIIPSLSLDQDVMARVTGAHHYEERMLCMLMLLKLPRTRIAYVTS
jgi:hypothetical protein